MSDFDHQTGDGMFKTIMTLMTDPSFMLGVLVAIGVAATIITLTMPLLERDQLKTRMKAVGVEREKIRARERARLAAESKISLRNEPKAYMRELVDRFNLRETLADEGTQNKLRMAGTSSGGNPLAERNRFSSWRSSGKVARSNARTTNHVRFPSTTSPPIGFPSSAASAVMSSKSSWIWKAIPSWRA